jgi:hypothetical protein
MKRTIPEKIYLTKNLLGEMRDGWDALPSNNSINIEYTRTDVLVKKARIYIAEHFLAPGMDNEINDFVNYMKGE